MNLSTSAFPVVKPASEGLIGWLTRRHDLGIIVRVDDTRAVASAISRLARNRELSARFGENGRRFSRVHDVAHFSGAVGEELILNFPLGTAGAHR